MGLGQRLEVAQLATIPLWLASMPAMASGEPADRQSLKQKVVSAYATLVYASYQDALAGRSASVTSMITGVVPPTAASSAAVNSRPCTIVKPSVLK